MEPLLRTAISASEILRTVCKESPSLSGRRLYMTEISLKNYLMTAPSPRSTLLAQELIMMLRQEKQYLDLLFITLGWMWWLL